MLTVAGAYLSLELVLLRSQIFDLTGGMSYSNERWAIVPKFLLPISVHSQEATALLSPFLETELGRYSKIEVCD